MVMLGVALPDRAVAHALERIRVDADGQVDVTDCCGKAEAGADAVQRDHPGADGRRDVTGTEPEREARYDETEPQQRLQQDVHALTAVVEALFRHALRLLANELCRELHEELHIVLVEVQDLADQRHDAGTRRDEQGDDRVQDEDDAEHVVHGLQRLCTESLVEEQELIGVERHRRQEQQEKRHGVDPVEVDEPLLMALDVGYVLGHHFSPFPFSSSSFLPLMPLTAARPSTPTSAPTPATLPSGRTTSFQMSMETGVLACGLKP